MRKWLVLIDATILITALLILVIDWQIKSDILAQAKSLQEVISGQGTKAADSGAPDLPGNILSGDVLDYPAMAVEASPKPRQRRNGSAKGNAGKTVSSGGNADPGIPAESE